MEQCSARAIAGGVMLANPADGVAMLAGRAAAREFVNSAPPPEAIVMASRGGPLMPGDLNGRIYALGNRLALASLDPLMAPAIRA
eukprot:6497710-Prymnesium_polylepis.1